MEHELELKLRLPAEEAPRLVRQPAIRHALSGRPRTTRLLTVYYDTPDNMLARQGMALRVRHVGKRRLQTLKVALDGRDGEALQRHDEWTAPIRSDTPDLTRLGHPGLRDRLGRHAAAGRLREVFRTEFKRRTFPLATGGAHIELALDEGEIRAGPRGEEISEVELELKGGAPSAVFDLARRLVTALPMHVEHRTKAARGYALAEGRGPVPVVADALPLEAEWSVWRGFVAVARNCLRQLYANEVAVLAGSDAEAVHQLRVGVRRLRAAFSAFGRALPAAEVEALKPELRWLQQTLGPARDWDVFIAETLDPLRAATTAEGGLDALVAAALAARHEAYEQARATLRSQRYALFQIRLEQWLESEGAPQGDSTLGAFSVRALAKRDKKLLKGGERIATLSDARLHEVRILAKKARYNAEFFRSLYARKAAKRYVRALREVQDCLGALNDAAVAKGLVESLGVAERHALALMDGWFAARIAGGKGRIAGVWDEFRAAPRFWED